MISQRLHGCGERSRYELAEFFKTPQRFFDSASIRDNNVRQSTSLLFTVCHLRRANITFRVAELQSLGHPDCGIGEQLFFRRNKIMPHRLQRQTDIVIVGQKSGEILQHAKTFTGSIQIGIQNSPDRQWSGFIPVR